jgi:signal transduction histidine kinase
MSNQKPGDSAGEHGLTACATGNAPADESTAVLAHELSSAHGKLVLDTARVDLTVVVARAVETAGPALLARDHRLTVALPPGTVFLVADALRLEQVLVNLLANAARYTRPNGDIRLTAAAAAGLVFVRVKDNGSGIAPDLLPHVFELYRSGNEGCVRCGPGIGLAVVKSIVERHSGTVTAHSDGPGTGSEFVIRLPADGPTRPDAAVFAG